MMFTAAIQGAHRMARFMKKGKRIQLIQIFIAEVLGRS